MPAPGVGPHAPRQRLASAGCRRQAAGSHRSARTGRVTGHGQPARLELLGGRLLGVAHRLCIDLQLGPLRDGPGGAAATGGH